MTHFIHGAAVIVTTARYGVNTKESGTFVEVHQTAKGPFYIVQIGDRTKKVRPVNVSLA